MFCTVCAAMTVDSRPTCVGCGAALRDVPTPQHPKLSWAATLTGVLPVAVVLAMLLTLVGRSWQQDGERAADYRSAEVALVEGRRLDARSTFDALGDYADAEERAAALNAQLAPLEARTRHAADMVSTGRSADAIVELLQIVEEVPDLQEATMLLEQARRSQAADAIAEADHRLAAGDVIGARGALIVGLTLEPTSTDLIMRLAELDQLHPLLLLTNDGDVAVTGFGEDDQRVIMDGEDASWAVWNPQRTMAAFQSVPESSDDWSSELWVVGADGSDQRLLVDDAFRYGAPSWSPDGRRLLFVMTDNYDRVRAQGWVGLGSVDLETGERRDLTGRRFHFTTSVVWSPDGRQVAFVERHIFRVQDTSTIDVRGGDVFLLDINTGETRNLTKGRIRDAYWVSWSPRGDQLLITTDVDQWATADPNRLVRLDLTTGELQEVETGGIVSSYPYWSPDGTMFAVAQDDRVVRIWSDDWECWVRLPVNVDAILSWAPDSSALLAPPKNVQDPAHVIHVGDQLGRIDTIRVVFDNSYSSGGPPQWTSRTRGAVDEPLPSGTALD